MTTPREIITAAFGLRYGREKGWEEAAALFGFLDSVGLEVREIGVPAAAPTSMHPTITGVEPVTEEEVRAGIPANPPPLTPCTATVDYEAYPSEWISMRGIAAGDQIGTIGPLPCIDAHVCLRVLNDGEDGLYVNCRNGRHYLHADDAGRCYGFFRFANSNDETNIDSHAVKRPSRKNHVGSEVVEHDAGLCCNGDVDVGHPNSGPIPNWIGGNSYRTGAMVRYGGKIWRAYQGLAEGGQTPDVSPYWEFITDTVS